MSGTTSLPPIIVSKDDPDYGALASFAGQSVSYQNPDAVPVSVRARLPSNVTYPLRLNFGTAPPPTEVPIPIDVSVAQPAAQAKKPDSTYVDPVTNQPALPQQSPPAELTDKDVLPPTAPGGYSHAVGQAKAQQLMTQPGAAAPPQELSDANVTGAVPDGKALYAPKIMAEAEKQGLTPQQARILVGIADQESSFNPAAQGKADPTTGNKAQGMFQMFPAAQQDAGVKNPLDPDQAIAGGVAYFKQMLDKANGDLPLAVGLYNAGLNAPDKINPAYVKGVFAKAAEPLPDNFQPLAARIYSLQHASQSADDPQNSYYESPGNWNFPTNTLNNLTLGGLKAVMDHVNAATYGTTPEQESALSQLYEKKWQDSAGTPANIASDVVGFALPDTLAAKGVMAGGRALAEAVPMASKVLSPVLGLAQGAGLGSRLAQLPRAALAGGASGVLNSQADQNKSVEEHALQGALGGIVGNAVIAPVARAVGSGLQTTYRALMSDMSPFIQEAREKVGNMLGTAIPPLLESTTPGVQYSLPEALNWQNKAINQTYTKVAKRSAELAHRVRSNSDAQLAKLAGTVGNVGQWQAAVDATKPIGEAIGHLASTSPVKMNLEKALAAVRTHASDPRREPIEGFPEAMRELEDRFFKEQKGKPTATQGDLEKIFRGSKETPAQKIAANGKYLVGRTATTGNEHAFVYDPVTNRNLPYEYEGTPTAVPIGAKGKEFLNDPKNAAIIQHTHPGELGGGLSLGDYLTTAWHGTSHIIAHTMDGHSHLGFITERPEVYANADKQDLSFARKIVQENFTKEWNKAELALESAFRKLSKPDRDIAKHEFYSALGKVLEYGGFAKYDTTKKLPSAVLNMAEDVARSLYGDREGSAAYNRLAEHLSEQEAMARSFKYAAEHAEQRGNGRIADPTGQEGLGEQELSDFEKGLYQALTQGEKAPVKKVLRTSAAEASGIRNYIQDQLDRKDTPTTVMSEKVKQALTDVKSHVDEELKKVPGMQDLLEQFAEHAQRAEELKYLLGKKFVNVRDNFNTQTLANTLDEIEKSPMVKGVKGTKAKAKSVTQETQEALQELLDDVKRTDRAKMLTGSISDSPQETNGIGHNVFSGIFHATAATGGGALGQATGLGIAPGAVAGMATSLAARKLVSTVTAKRQQAMLEVLLNPKLHPPIAPGVRKTPPGALSGIYGGNAF